MGLINQTERQYYEGVDGIQNSGKQKYGNYQFVSLTDIINQFIIAYVGEEKIISKIKRLDVAFHAQRALQELSFDTFKSTKSFEMEVSSSLQMPLPIDYVNYVCVSTIDASGVKRKLYPTSKSSNPSAYQQNADGSFKFETNSFNNQSTNLFDDYGITNSGNTSSASGTGDAKSDKLLPQFVKETRIAVRNSSGYNSKEITYGPGGANPMLMNFFTAGHDIEVGMTIFGPGIPENTTVSFVGASTSNNFPGMGIKMTNPVYEKYLLEAPIATTPDITGYPSSAQVLGEEVIFVNLNKQSDSWAKYKNHSSSSTSNTSDDYEDDLYWPNRGGRYGLDPQYAQVNGSYFIDDKSGLIYFSSAASGATIVLDYISDSLGTDDEMQVHKLAEEAMYKCIAYAIMSTRANVQEYIVRRFQKDRFAAVRKAKLRLSNLKIEELTQIFRGKSKQIKH